MDGDSPRPDRGADARPRVSNEIANNSGTAAQIGGDVHGGVHFHIPTDLPAHRPLDLPARSARFVDRDEERAGIGAELGNTTGTSLVVLEGVRGIGKSALLLVAAAQFGTADRFPGGVYYVEYPRDRSDDRADPDHWITTLLVALDVERDHLPPTREERLATYRARGGRAAMLIVIEGATDAAQIRALLPSADGSAVLAACDGPALDELEADAVPARIWTLRPLAPEAGRELLVQLSGGRIGPERQAAADRLVAACGGLPLALVLVAARIRRHPETDIAAVAEELADHQRRLAGIGDRTTLAAQFDLTYRELSPGAAAMYRALGDWPGTHLDTWVAAALAGTDADRARELVAELYAANVLERVAPERHSFRHGLIRDHAREHAASEDGPAARTARLRRALDAYRTVLAFADLAVRGERLRVTDTAALTAASTDPFGGSRTRALSFLRGERDTLVAAVRAALEAECYDHAWQCAELATALYLTDRYLHDWVTVCSTGADAARLAGDPEAEARLRSLVSRPLVDLERLPKAEKQIDRAVELVVDGAVERLLVRASVHEFHGRYLHAANRLDEAVVAFDRAEELHERVRAEGDGYNGSRGTALAAYFRGLTRDRAGDHDRAVADLTTALGRFDALTTVDTRMAARTRDGLGRAFHRGGRPREALRELRSAVRTFHDLGEGFYEAEATVELVEVLAGLGSYPEAVTRMRRAVTIYQEGGNPKEHRARHRLVELERAAGEEDPGDGT